MGLFPTDAEDNDEVTNTHGTTFKYIAADDKWIIVTDYTVSDLLYNEGTWDANTDAATKNAIRDKIEALVTLIADAIATSNAALMIGAANSALVPCTYVTETTHATIDVSGGYIINAGATDAWWYFIIPLPTNRGGKKLYVKDVVLEVKAADAVDDYIDTVTMDLLRDDDITNITLIDSDTNRTAQGTYTYANTVADDASGHSIIAVQILARCGTAGQLAILNPLVECYYDD